MLGSKQGAVRIKDKMNKAAKQILIFPENTGMKVVIFHYSGMSVPDFKLSKLGFRMIVVEKYLMFYKVSEDEKKIIFYRVLNGKTNYPTLMYKLYKDE